LIDGFFAELESLRKKKLGNALTGLGDRIESLKRAR
jgi:hypothetical protein